MLQNSRSLFRPDRFGHANLFVADMEASVAYYRDVCGITEVFREPEIKAAFLSNGATHHDVAVMQVSNKPLRGKDGSVQNTMVKGRQPGLNHLAFHVASEAALIEAFRSAGEHGIQVEKALDHGMSRSLYILDPDGLTIEFYVDTAADWRAYYAEHRDELISSRWNPDSDPPAIGVDSPPRVDMRVAGARFRTIEICGATVIVSDLATSRRFYESTAGLEVLFESANAIVLGIVGTQQPCLALSRYCGLDRIGLESLWFLADPDLPGFSAEGSTRRCRMHDPDGVNIRFFAGPESLPRAAGARASTQIV